MMSVIMMVNKRSPSERGLKMKKTSSSMTAKMSAFARAYYAEHAKKPAFEDAIAKKLCNRQIHRVLKKNGAGL